MNCHALMISLWTLRDLRAQEDADLLWIKLIVKLVLDTSLRVGWITFWNCLSPAINLEVAWMTSLGKTANFRMAKLIQLPTTSVWTNLNWNLKVWFCFITLAEIQSFLWKSLNFRQALQEEILKEDAVLNCWQYCRDILRCFSVYLLIFCTFQLILHKLQMQLT